MNLRTKLVSFVLLAASAGLSSYLAKPALIALADNGEVVKAEPLTPCWLRRVITTTPPGPSGGTYREIAVGNMWGKMSGADGGAFADAYYDGDPGDCNYGDQVNGLMGAGVPLFIRVESAMAIDDDSGFTAGSVRFDFTLRRLVATATSCSGSVLWSVPRSHPVTFSSSNQWDWKEVRPWTPTGGDTLVVTDTTPSSGTVWYTYTLTTTTTKGGTTYGPKSQVGCFKYTV